MQIDRGTGVCIDSNDDVVVTGIFIRAVDFDPGPGNVFFTAGDEYGSFMSKFDSNGQFLWARTLSGNGHGKVTSSDCAIDASGNIYISGDFSNSIDFDPSDASLECISNGSNDTFISKYNIEGEFQWVRTGGGSGSDNANNIFIGGNDVIHIIGTFADAVAFNPESASDLTYSRGNSDVFIEAVDAEGNFLWVKTWGGTGSDLGQGLTVDTTGTIFVSGRYLDEVEIELGPDGKLPAAGAGDAFLYILNSSGDFQKRLTWQGASGNTVQNYINDASDVVLDSQDNIIVTGSCWGLPEFGFGIRNITGLPEGTVQAYLVKMNK